MDQRNNALTDMPRTLIVNAMFGAILGAVLGGVLIALDVAGIASLIRSSDHQVLFKAAFIVHLMATFAVALVATAISSSRDQDV